MTSKNKINERMRKKTNPELAETIFIAKKKNFLELAKKLSISTKKQSRVNVGELDRMKEDKIIVSGKVLGSGNINKKISVAALGFSSEAKDKLKKSGSEMKTIRKFLEENAKLTGVKII